MFVSLLLRRNVLLAVALGAEELARHRDQALPDHLLAVLYVLLLWEVQGEPMAICLVAVFFVVALTQKLLLLSVS